MAGIGDLVIKLSADTAALSRDMGQAVGIFGRHVANMEARAKSFQRVVGSAFGAAIGAELISGIGRVIDSFDQLNDSAKKFNAPVDQVAAFASIAKQTGTDIETLAKASQKLNVELLDAGKAGSEAARLFSALKLDPKALQSQGGVDAIIEVIGALERIPNASERAAAAQKVFNKSAAEMIPLMSEGSANLRAMQKDFNDLKGNTSFAEMAKEADRFNDNITRLKVVFNAFVADLLGPVLKALNTVLERFLTARKLTLQTGSSTGALNIAGTSTEDIGPAIEKAKKDVQTSQAIIADIEKNAYKLRDARLTIQKKALAERQGRLDKLLALQQIRASEDAAASAKKPNTDFAAALNAPKTGRTRKAPSTFGSQRDELRQTEFLVGQERDILQERSNALQAIFDRSQISIKDYYSTLQGVQLDYLRNVQGYYDAEIAALQAYIAKKNTSPEDKQRASEKLADLQRRRADATKDASAQINRAQEQQQRSLEEQQRAVNSVSADYLEMSGHGKEAAAIRFDAQTESLRRLLEVNGSKEALAKLDALREQTVAQGALNDAQRNSGIILDSLGNLEAGIQRAREKGIIGEIDAMQQLGEARRRAADALEGQVNDAQRVAAQRSATLQQQQDAENLKARYDALRGSVNVLADTVNTSARDSFASAFTDFIKGAKSAGDAIKSFAQGVADTILNLAAKQLGTQLFNSLFGETGGGSGGGGGGLGSIIASIFTGGRAVGGLVKPGGLYMVNEGSKKEAFMPLAAGRVAQSTPGEGWGGVLNISVNVPQGTSRSTADQTAASVGVAVRRALKRNN
jgi:hypothetical protein